MKRHSRHLAHRGSGRLHSIALPPLDDVGSFGDVSFGDLFATENLKDMAIVGGIAAGTIIVANVADAQLKKIPAMGAYMKYLSPAIPFVAALAAAKYGRPKFGKLADAAVAAGLGIGFYNLAKAFGLFGAVGLSGLMGEDDAPLSADIYMPELLGFDFPQVPAGSFGEVPQTAFLGMDTDGDADFADIHTPEEEDEEPTDGLMGQYDDDLGEVMV